MSQLADYNNSRRQTEQGEGEERGRERNLKGKEKRRGRESQRRELQGANMWTSQYFLPVHRKVKVTILYAHPS